MPKVSTRESRPQMTRKEEVRGWCLLVLYLVVFPTVMGLLQRLFPAEGMAAERNVIYYAVISAVIFAVFWSFLRHALDLFLDDLPRSCLAMGTGLLAWLLLFFPARMLPLPIEDPNVLNYQEQFALSPAATVLIVVVFLPVVEEILFRGLIFSSLRRHSRVLAWLVSVFGFALYCVWQFIFAYDRLDLRYLILMVRYLPTAVACTWCYDNSGSVWSPVILHMLTAAGRLYLALT